MVIDVDHRCHHTSPFDQVVIDGDHRCHHTSPYGQVVIDGDHSQMVIDGDVWRTRFVTIWSGDDRW